MKEGTQLANLPVPIRFALLPALEVARQRHGAGDVAHRRTRTIDLVVATVETGDHAGISLVTQGHIRGQVPDLRKLYAQCDKLPIIKGRKRSRAGAPNISAGLLHHLRQHGETLTRPPPICIEDSFGFNDTRAFFVLTRPDRHGRRPPELLLARRPCRLALARPGMRLEWTRPWHDALGNAVDDGARSWAD